MKLGYKVEGRPPKFLHGPIWGPLLTKLHKAGQQHYYTLVGVYTVLKNVDSMTALMVLGQRRKNLATIWLNFTILVPPLSQ